MATRGQLVQKSLTSSVLTVGVVLSQANWVRGVLIVTALVSGCGSLPPLNSKISDCETHPSGWCQHTPQGVTSYPGQSWDQANLKRNDSGCPTAIYVAPEGNLALCGP